MLRKRPNGSQYPISVIDVYERLFSAPDDKTRARIIATAFERLEDRYPELKDLATATGVRETELRLLKEIEQIRQETQHIRADLHKFAQQIQANMHAMEQQIRKDIEQIRADMHQTELRLQKEIAEVNLKIEMTSKKTGAVDGGVVFYLRLYPDCGDVWGKSVVIGSKLVPSYPPARATTATSTVCAPPALSPCANSRSVLPVVITSSINST